LYATYADHRSAARQSKVYKISAFFDKINIPYVFVNQQCHKFWNVLSSSCVSYEPTFYNRPSVLIEDLRAESFISVLTDSAYIEGNRISISALSPENLQFVKWDIPEEYELEGQPTDQKVSIKTINSENKISAYYSKKVQFAIIKYSP